MNFYLTTPPGTGRCPYPLAVLRAFVLVWIVLEFGTNATAAGRASSVTSDNVSPDQPLADFDFMRKVLEEAHPGLYRYATATELDRKFAAQRAKLSQPMAKSGCYETFAETLGLVKCGHTSINPDETAMQGWQTARRFPLRVMIEDGRLIVLSNDTPDNQTIAPDMELLEINGHLVPELLRRFARIESSDGAIQTSKWVHIQRGFAMYYWFLVEQPDSFFVKAKAADGQLLEVKLAGLTRDELGKSENPVNARIRAGMKKIDWTQDDLAWRFLRQPDLAELRIRSFNGDNFPHWVDAIFKTLAEQGTRTLIIDLRGNGGGPDMHGAMLVSYLMDRPFRYFDHIIAKTIDPSFKAQADWSEERTRELSRETIPGSSGEFQVKHAGLAEQAPGKYPFRGKVIVLIDGGVFSTAADFCAITHHLGRATFVGEETGGGYGGNNSGAFVHVTLPNTHFQIRLPLYGYWNAVGGDNGRGTVPDHKVMTKVASLLRGVDEPLEMALKLAAGH